MRTVRWMTWVLAGLLVLGPGAVQAQVPNQVRERRADLERQVRQRFLSQVEQRLELTEEQRDQVRDALSASADARMDLALESRALRIEVMQAVRDEDASMDRYRDILDRLTAIREEERAIEVREAEALEQILDPRQQVLFLVMRMQFNERIRALRGGGPGAGGPPGPLP